MNPLWHIRTGRLHLSPVGWADLPDLRRLKGDPATYAQMLGGVRNPAQVAEELATDTQYWAARGVGMWIARPAWRTARPWAPPASTTARTVAARRCASPFTPACSRSRPSAGGCGRRPPLRA